MERIVHKLLRMAGRPLSYACVIAPGSPLVPHGVGGVRARTDNLRRQHIRRAVYEMRTAKC